MAVCYESLVEDRDAKAPWWERKVGYMEHLASEPAELALMSAADQLHNACSILGDYRLDDPGHAAWLPSRFSQGESGPV